jgi:hypothetical protein
MTPQTPQLRAIAGRHIADTRRAVGLPLALVVGATCAALAVAIAQASSGPGDYLVHGGVSGDNAGPAVNALSHWDVGAFVAHQPLMGLTSLLLRAAFVLAAAPFGHGNTHEYVTGAAACLIPAAVLVVWVAFARYPGRDWFGAAVAAFLLLASPVALDAVGAGHPEEILASVLATGAVLAAIREHDIWAGAFLGLAVGTKQWAVIAALPVFTALHHDRTRSLLIAAASALVLNGVAPLADLGAFTHAGHAVAATHVANIASAWWPLSSPMRTPASVTLAVSSRWLPFGMTRSEALLAALAVAVLAVLVRSRHDRLRCRLDALALLALLGLVRCAADPGDLNYYFVAALVPLTVWEISNRSRAPVIAVITTGAVALTIDSGASIDPELLNALVIGWILVLGCYLTRSTFRPRDVVQPRLSIHRRAAQVNPRPVR